MSKTIVIPVIFRKDKNNNELLAIYPSEPASIGCFQYMGKYGSSEMSYDFYSFDTTPASFEEYQEMWQELAKAENSWNDNYIVFDVVNKITYNMCQDAWYNWKNKF